MILKKIIANKRSEVAKLKKITPLSVLKKAVADLGKKTPRFAKALKKSGEVSVIAEIKRRSPSKGLLRSNFNPEQLARDYQKAGAAAISVLTDEKFFGGSPDHLKRVRKAVLIPLLRKDFCIDEYQIYEARLLGADAVLLIAAVLSKNKLKRFQALAHKLGLDALIEVHSAGEHKKALAVKPKLIGINNRDLKSFSVDTRTSQKLAARTPKGIVLVSESGIRSRKDMLFLKALRVDAALVGEALMKKKDVKKALLGLRGIHRG
jgi:indole-3-glycerol phosphate synthase